MAQSRLDDDFADMLVDLEPGSSGGDLIERKAAVDDRPEPAVAQRGKRSAANRLADSARCAGVRKRLVTP